MRAALLLCSRQGGAILLCSEIGVLPGSDYYIYAGRPVNTALHPVVNLCGHYHCVAGYEIKRAWYELNLITYILGGTFWLEYGGKSYEAHEGDIVAINCQHPHAFGAGEHMEFVWVHFSGGQSCALIDEVNSRYGPVLRHGNCGYLHEQLTIMVSDFRNNQPRGAERLALDLLDLIYHLYPPDEPVVEQTKGGQAVMLAIEFMKLHLAEPVSVDEIADFVHMSKYHFSRIFRQAIGYSPYEYLLILKINLAKHLISTTEQTVAEIAYHIGYRSETGFANLFTEKVGIPPGRYREMHRVLAI